MSSVTKSPSEFAITTDVVGASGTLLAPEIRSRAAEGAPTPGTDIEGASPALGEVGPGSCGVPCDFFTPACRFGAFRHTLTNDEWKPPI
jgi:hypothetical protein